MYTRGDYQAWHNASQKPVPDRGTQPLNTKGKGKERQVSFSESATGGYREALPTPASSPTKDVRPDTTLSVGVDVPLRLSSSPSDPVAAARSYVSSPRPKTGWGPALPPVPQSPQTPRHQQSSSDPTFFRLPQSGAQNIRQRISAPLQPIVSDVEMQVERDAQQVLPVFDFTMKFRVSLTKREMPQ